MKQDSKKVLIIGALAGILAAGFKTRQHITNGGSHSSSVTPTQLSRNDWKAVLTGTFHTLSSKSIPTLAAGVAYYSVLAFFPALAAGVAVAALLITPEQLESLIRASETYLPPDIANVVTGQLERLVSQRTGNILAAVIAIAIALFGASGASKNLVIASNAAYSVRETRGWLTQQAWGILWTIAGMGFGFIVLALLAANRTMLGHIGVGDFFVPLFLYGRWVVIVLLAIFGLAVFYRHGPNRPRVRWHWASWGAVIATVVWMIATVVFFAYIQNFANYTQSYSLFAGIIALMIWLNLSALIVLVGATINHQLELVGSDRAAAIFQRKS